MSISGNNNFQYSVNINHNNQIADLIQRPFDQMHSIEDINIIKNMIENAYLQHVQMIKTNASVMKNYSSMFGNSEIGRNIEKMDSDFLAMKEESKNSMIKQLELAKDNYLSKAAKINEGYNKMTKIDKFVPNPDGSVGQK